MQHHIKNIEEALDLILAKMQSKGLLPVNCDIDVLKKDVLKHLHENDIDTSSLNFNNESTKKLLVGVVISVMLGVKNDDFTKEFKSGDPTEPNEKLDKQLAAGIVLVGTLLGLKMDQHGKNLMDDILKPVLANMKNHPAPSPEMKKTHEQDVDVIEKQISDIYRLLNGGKDPRVADEITAPVIGQILGNIAAFTNQTAADPKATSFMVESITFNAGKFDYTGLENSEKLSELMSIMHTSPTLTAK